MNTDSILNFSESAMLRQKSIDFLRDQVKYNVIEWEALLADATASFISLYLLLKNKLDYKSRTYFFLKLLFFNCLSQSVYSLPFTSWHIFNGMFGLDEVYSKRICFLVNQFQFFFVHNNCAITLLVSFDSLLVTLQKSPTLGSNFSPSKPKFLALLIGILSINIMIQIFLISDDYSGSVISCTARGTLGDHFALPVMLVFVVLTWLAFFVDIFMLIVALVRYKNQHVVDSVDLIAIKRARRITLVLTYTSLVYLFVGPMSTTVLTVLLASGSNAFLLQTIMPLVSWLIYVEAVFYTGSLLLLEDYRRDFKKTFGKCFKCFQNQVGVVEPIQLNVIHLPSSSTHGLGQPKVVSTGLRWRDHRVRYELNIYDKHWY